MGLAGRSTIGVLATVLLMHAPAVTAPLGDPAPIGAPSHPRTLAPSHDTLSCLQPVERSHMDSVERQPVRRSISGVKASADRSSRCSRSRKPGDIIGMHIVSWNVNVGAGTPRGAAATSGSRTPPAPGWASPFCCRKRFAPATRCPSAIRQHSGAEGHSSSAARRWTFAASPNGSDCQSCTCRR